MHDVRRPTPLIRGQAQVLEDALEDARDRLAEALRETDPPLFDACVERHLREAGEPLHRLLLHAHPNRQLPAPHRLLEGVVVADLGDPALRVLDLSCGEANAPQQRLVRFDVERRTHEDGGALVGLGAGHEGVDKPSPSG